MAGAAASAVVYWDPDGYDTGRPRLMGRQAAGAGFLRALVRHGRATRIVCMARDRASAEEFARVVRGAEGDPPRRQPHTVTWVPRGEPDRLADVGCLYYPSPTLANFAWQRRLADERAWSLCGVTHTTASDTVMEAIGSFVTAPLHPWDAVICTSRAVRATVDHVTGQWQAWLRERLGVGAAGRARAVRLELPIIPLGVDCRQQMPDPAVRKATRTRLGIADDAVAALFLGRLTATAKAHPLPMLTGLEAAAAQTGKRVHLILAGWFEVADEEREFQALAMTFAPHVRLHILDARDPQVRKGAWSAADLFTSLSDNVQETFGLTPVEAMATGLPLVVSAWDGYRDTMTDGVEGFAIPTVAPPPGAGAALAGHYRSGHFSYGGYIGRAAQFTAVDPAGVTEAYARLLADPALRTRMGDAGRRRARRQFDWSVVIAAYEQLWDELAARRAAAAPLPPRPPRAAADPLRDDPYAAFAAYPSFVVTPDCRALRIAGAPSLDRLMSFRVNTFASGLMLGRDGIGALLAALGAAGQPVTVAELLAPWPNARHDDAIRTLIWLQKMGQAVILPPA
ncbi:MAG: glycosyltransferase family 4 protein [Alphaproteobacteria bacterium]